MYVKKRCSCTYHSLSTHTRLHTTEGTHTWALYICSTTAKSSTRQTAVTTGATATKATTATTALPPPPPLPLVTTAAALALFAVSPVAITPPVPVPVAVPVPVPIPVALAMVTMAILMVMVIVATITIIITDRRQMPNAHESPHPRSNVPQARAGHLRVEHEARYLWCRGST